jgi:hypothetical protein
MRKPGGCSAGHASIALLISDNRLSRLTTIKIPVL